MKKIIFSALVAIVAVGGALSSNANAKRVDIPGYQFNASAPCSIQKVPDCNAAGPSPCTYKNTPTGPLLQAYSQSTSSTCTVALNRF